MRSRRKTGVGLLSYVLLGAASAVVGLVPWLLTGMRLPLQNLWAAATPWQDMPLVLLPFSQYQLTDIAGLMVTGSAIAGIITRLLVRRRPRFSVPAVILGVVAVQLVATVQTSSTVSQGLLENSASELYLSALISGTIASIMVGVLVLFLVARAPASGAMIGASIAAVAFSPWLGALFYPLDSVATAPNAFTRGLVEWSPAIVVGVAMAAAGLASTRRVVAAAFSLLVLWVGPALFTAMSAAAGTRVLAYRPAEMAKYGLQVFQGALDVRTGSLAPLAVAAVVTILGLALQRQVRRRNAETVSA